MADAGRRLSITLDSLALRWPQANGNLNKVKLAGTTIFKLEQQSQGTSISGDWAGKVGDRAIGPGESAWLELEFKSTAAGDSALYFLAAHSSAGRPTELVPLASNGAPAPKVGEPAADEVVVPSAADVLSEGHPVLETHYPTRVNGSAVDCANRWLDIASDLAGIQHHGGPVNEDGQGNFFIMSPDGLKESANVNEWVARE